MNKSIISAIFPGAMERINQGLCPMCGEPVKREDLKNEISKKEYDISKMCQKCQDEIWS